jgi:hypothetical protein
MSKSDDQFDEFYEALKQEYDTNGHNRVSQEELDKSKAVPKDSTLVVSGPQGSSGMGMRQPTVRPALDTRRAKKAAEAEQLQQWGMVQRTNRTALATESVAAVCVHGFRVLDKTQAVIADEYYGVKRNEAMSEMMRRFAAKCLGCAESGILAVMESHPKRIAEDL